MDFGDTGGSRGTKEILDNTTSAETAASSHADSIIRRFAAVYLLHDSRGEHRVSSRASGRRTCLSSATSCLFHQRSSGSLEEKIPSSSEAIIYSTSNCTQAPSLLRRPQSRSSHWFSNRGYSSQQRSHRENSQMGLRENPEIAEVWRMYFDGSLKLQGAGAGILFTAPGANTSDMPYSCYFQPLTMQQNMKLRFTD
jgi:hypothetical protein